MVDCFELFELQISTKIINTYSFNAGREVLKLRRKLMLSIYSRSRTDREVAKIMKHPARFKEGILDGARKSGRAIQKRATTMLSTGTRSGRKYPNLKFQSSAPGEYPRSQSGELMRTVYYDSSPTSIRVGATATHALYLEEGTKRMSARPHPSLPWLRLAMELEERNIVNYLRESVREKLEC
jgi:hypothetical protein